MLDEHENWDARVREAYAQGRAAWPGFELPFSAFSTALQVEQTSIVGPDLYLALGCVHRLPGSVEAFTQTHGALFETAVPARIRASGIPEDFASIMTERVLVGSSEPLLARYRGEGSLEGWLRVTIARAAISEVRKRATAERREADLPDLLGMMSAQRDTELDYVRHLYRDAFRSAFEGAVGQLSERERSLVHLSAVRGVSVRKLGKMYGVGHSTAARWVNKAVATLSAEVRTRLASSLDSEELESVMQVLGGSLELSISRIFDGSSDEG